MTRPTAANKPTMALVIQFGSLPVSVEARFGPKLSPWFGISNTMKRRTFLKLPPLAMTALVGVPLAAPLIGCDDGGQPAFRVSNLGTDDHEHTLVIVCADEDKATVTYNATGSGHVHPVTLTGEQITMIVSGQTVTIETDDSHAHSWSLSMPTNGCAGPAEPTSTVDDGGGW